MKELGVILKKARLESGLTQIEFSRMARLSLKEIQKIEWGKANPTLRTLARISKILSGAVFKVGSKGLAVEIFITQGKLPKRKDWLGDIDVGAISRSTGVGESNIYKLCRSQANPTARTLEKLGIGLGLRFIIS